MSATAHDRFRDVLGEQPAGSDRPDDPWAVVELHLPSVYRPGMDAEALVAFLDAEQTV